MNHRKIISLALEAGGTSPVTATITLTDEAVVKFANLVISEERDGIGADLMAFYRHLVHEGDSRGVLIVEHCMNLIRLRSRK
jgi:hypothetical protein